MAFGKAVCPPIKTTVYIYTLYIFIDFSALSFPEFLRPFNLNLNVVERYKKTGNLS